jgi:hypothetical protein
MVLRLALVCSIGNAADIAHCGASEGYGYYPKIGLGASDSRTGKWTKDQIRDGRLTLTLGENNTFDIIALDARDAPFSFRTSGASVSMIGKTDVSLSILAAFPMGIIETYTFLRNTDGRAEVMWTQNKYGTPIPKVAAFRSNCSFLAF